MPLPDGNTASVSVGTAWTFLRSNTSTTNGALQGSKTQASTRHEWKITAYLDQLRRLEVFYKQPGHINVPQLISTDEWPGAGRCFARIRSLRRAGALPQAIVDSAEKMSIIWIPGQGSLRKMSPELGSTLHTPSATTAFPRVHPRHAIAPSATQGLSMSRLSAYTVLKRASAVRRAGPLPFSSQSRR